ncbi:MAG: 4Fe-4S dicluster domain-containing protein [Candidatus Thermoplasmatota archaeon]|jgi:heterodisulfide reductase subunit C|nr:4Fe-4S dicluster domain-containing protein [Candidatus Thermoplasmatota archaeon]
MDVIDSQKIDPNFKFQIAKEEGGEGILKCFACGSCTASCPEMDVKQEWNPRLIIRKALIGLKEEVLTSEFVWICSAHYRCLEKCPQGVNVKEVMNAVRNAKLKEEQEEDLTGKKTKKILDLNFKYKIVEDKSGKDLYECFSCGTCTAGCPERELDSLYSPRKVIKNVLLGMKEPVFNNKFVEICSRHHRCFTQCPQGVEIPKLMNAIKKIAEKEKITKPM